jgi:hypothetical protein
MPRDHISDFESVGGRVLCGGTGSDSGELYSRLDGNCQQQVELLMKTLTSPYSRSSRGAFAAYHEKFQNQIALRVGWRVISEDDN